MSIERQFHIAPELRTLRLTMLENRIEARRKSKLGKACTAYLLCLCERASKIEALSNQIMSGAVERVRPKMMTVTAIMAGLLPILWSTGTGSELMRRIAVPMVGGMASSAVLTLLVIPALYAAIKGVGLPSTR